MKKMVGAVSAFALAIGVTPIAMAQTTTADEARSYVIDVKGEILPVSLGDLSYPYRAASRGTPGSCDIVLQVSEAGSADSYNVQSCSDSAFVAAADAFADTLAFESARAGETHELTVVWSMEDAR